MYTIIFLIVWVLIMSFIYKYFQKYYFTNSKYQHLRESEKELLANKKSSNLKIFSLIIIVFGVTYINSTNIFNTDSEEKQVSVSKIPLPKSKYAERIDSLERLPVSVKFAKLYKEMNSSNIEGDRSMFVGQNIENLQHLLISAEGSDYEIKIRKSIDSLEAIKIKGIATELIKNRQSQEKILRNKFLDNNLNIKVKVSGKNSDVVTLTYSLFDEVWFRKFETQGHFDELNKMGFKKIILSDSYDYTQWMEYK